MKERTTGSLLRSVALLGAVAASATAFGNYVKEWHPTTDVGYWEDASNWETLDTQKEGWPVVAQDNIDPDTPIDDWRIGNYGSGVEFRSAVVEDDAVSVLIYNNTQTFSADEETFGLTKASAGMYVSTWWDNGAVTLNIASGTYAFGTVGVNEAGSANQNATAALNLNGGTLSAGVVSLAQGGTLTLNGGVFAAPRVNGNGTVVIGANGATIDGNCSIDAAVTGSGTITKTGEGQLYIANGTGFTGAVVVEAGTFTGDYAATVDGVEGTYYMNAQGAFDAVADGGTVVLLKSATVNIGKLGTFNVQAAEGVELTVTSTAPYSATYDAESGIVTSVRVATEYVYVGPVHAAGHSNQAASIYELRTAGNFTINGEATELIPGTGDTIVITSSPWFRFADTKNLWYTIAPAIRIEEGYTVKIDLRTNQHLGFGGAVTGEGALDFASSPDAAEFFLTSNELSCKRVIVNAKFRIATTSDYATISSNLEGTGSIEVDEQRKQESRYAIFSGDNSNFAGSMRVTNYADNAHRDFVRFADGKAVSEKATWTLWGNDKNTSNFTPFMKRDTYKFGALNGYICMFTANVTGYTVEVGAKNEDCAFGGTFCRGYKNTTSYLSTLRKVGTAELTITAETMGWIEIADGILNIGSAQSIPDSRAWVKFTGGTLRVSGTTTTAEVTDPETGDVITPAVTSFADPSAVLKDSSEAPIVFDSNGGDHTWATALAASNTKGLVKKGEGTLTLSEAPLASDFPIMVEEGAVVAPEGVKLGVATVVDTSAEVGDGFVKLVHTDVIAEVDGTTYATLAEAIENANGATITLIASTDEGFSLVDGQSVTINHTASNYGAGTISVPEDYRLKTVAVEGVDYTYTYTCEAINYVAQVGEDKYETLAAAIEAANGATITLLQATEEGFTLAADQTVTINHTENNYGAGTISVPEGYTLKFEAVADTEDTYAYSCEVKQSEPAATVEPGQTQVVADREAANAVEMGVPAAVSGALTPEQVASYTECFVRKVTEVDGGFSVSFELKSDVEATIQAAVDGVFEGEGENVVDVSALASATAATTVEIAAVPGLYYGVTYGNGLGGSDIWTTNAKMATGSTVEITFPDARGADAQFYQVIVSPTDPAAATVADPAEGEAGNGDDQA